MLNKTVSPYHDDFSEDKNFHQVMFVPGNPIQARELTQLQSILQNQIKRGGDHLFKNGSMVIPGQVFYDNQITFIKLEQFHNGAYADALVESVVGKVITGVTSGVSAKVIAVEKSTTDDPATLFVRYVGANGTNSIFQQAEALESENGVDLLISSISTFTGLASVCSIADGIYYVNGYFVKVLAQQAVISKYSTVASARVGLNVLDSFVTSSDDESLFDNALGFSNYSAPGAHRYKIELELVVRDINFTDSNTASEQKFIEILQIKDGNIQFMINETKYSEIEKMLAKRTYEESGDYVVAPFSIAVKEYRSNDRGQWLANTAYLKGDIVKNGSYYYYARTEGISSSTAPTHTYGSGSDGAVYWSQISKQVANGGVYPASNTDSLSAHRLNEAKLALDVSPGKAYVQGFGVEKIIHSIIAFSKSRDAVYANAAQMYSPLGAYVTVNTLVGIPGSAADPITSLTVKDIANVSIGTVFCRNIEHIAGTAGTTSATYRVYIFGVKMTAGADFAFQATALTGTNFSASLVQKQKELSGVLTTTSASATVTGKGTNFDQELFAGSRITVGTQTKVVQALDPVLYDTQLTTTSTWANTLVDAKAYINYIEVVDNGGYIAPLPNVAIKTIRTVDGAIDTQYVITKRITFTASGSSYVAQLTLPGETFEVVGHMISNSSAGDAIVDATYSLDITATQLTVGGLTTANNYELLALVRRSNAAAKEKVKTLSTKTILVTATDVRETTNGLTGSVVSSNWNFTNNIISLTEADAVVINKITMSGDNNATTYNPSGETDITYKYFLNVGQTSEFYDISSIQLMNGQTKPTNMIKVTFDYFDHSAGDYFSVDSYSGIPDIFIPTFDSINLKDVLDFRPRIGDDGVSFSTTGAMVGDPLRSDYTLTMDYAYYLPRRDILSINTAGEFQYSLGVSGVSIPLPVLPSASLGIAEVYLPPNATAKGAIVSIQSNKRYTMKDIAKIDNRLQNVEKYVALTLLEKKTNDLKVFDQYGLERFKSGFLVDEFKDHNVGDSAGLEYRCAVDPTNKELRPRFYTDNITLIEPEGTTEAIRTSKHYKVTGSIATLPYTLVECVKQNIASRGEFINPFNVASFSGLLELAPRDDTWVDIRRLADQVSRIGGNFDFLQSTRAGTQWGGWANSSGPVNDQLTTNQLVTQSRTNTTTSITESWDEVSRTSIISQSDELPLMRRKSTVVTLTGMKPWASMYSFLDTDAINGILTPASTIILTAVPTIPFIGYRNSVVSTDNISLRTTSVANYDILNRGEVIKTAGGKSGVVIAYETRWNKNTNLAEVVLMVSNVKGGAFAAADVIFGQTSGATATVASYTAGTVGVGIETNSKGNFYGVIEFAGATYKTGSHTVKILDRSSGSEFDATSQARAEYLAKGTLNTLQDLVTQQRNGVIAQRVWSESQNSFWCACAAAAPAPALNPNRIVRTMADGFGGDITAADWAVLDPLSQTFRIPAEYTKGVMCSQLDIYFHTKNPADRLPVRVEIVETENGYPTRNILFGATSVKQAEDIVASNTTMIASPFKLQQPVFLEPRKEYAIKVLSDSFDYKVWIARMSEARIDNKDLIITEQPSIGSLFKSQNNSTWTAEQYEDLAFTLYKNKFDITKSGSIDFANVDTDWVQLPGNPFKETNTSSKVRVNHPDHNMFVGMYVTYSGSTVGGYNATFEILTVTNSDSYIIDKGSAAGADAIVGGAAVNAVRSIRINTAHITADAFVPASTGLDYTIRASDENGREPIYTQVIGNADFDYSTSKYVYSKVNETNLLSGEKSLDVRLNLYSFSEDLSPMIMLDGTSVVSVANRINSPSATDNYAVVDDEVAYSGTGITFNTAGYFTSTNSLAAFKDGMNITVTGATSAGNNIGPVQITAVDLISSPNKVTISSAFGVNEVSVGGTSIKQHTTFIDEHAAETGSAEAKYETKAVILENSATSLQIMYAANVPNACDVELWYRAAINSSLNPIRGIKWTKVTTVYRKSNSRVDFEDQEYLINTGAGFNTFQIKLVMKSTEQSSVPRIKDLRVIALA